MAILPTKTERDNLNLDRLDKAFVWACLKLRSHVLSALNPANAVNGNNKYSKYISISHDLFNLTNGIKDPILNLRIKLPYDSSSFLSNGGNILGYIKEIADSFNTDNSQTFYKSVNKTIISEPNTISSLEKYVYWLALQIISTNYANNKDINITLNEETYPDNYIQIDAKFSMVIQNFFSGLPYVDCLNLVIIPVQSSTMSNSFVAGNASLIGN